MYKECGIGTYERIVQSESTWRYTPETTLKDFIHTITERYPGSMILVPPEYLGSIKYTCYETHAWSYIINKGLIFVYVER